MEATIKMFKALSDETRLRIYLLLLQGELCVCELVNILEMEQSRRGQVAFLCSTS